MAKKTKKGRVLKTNKLKGKVSTRLILDYSKSLENIKHERFCQEYVVCLNATDAYQTAYPKCTAITARSNGSELLTKTNVLARIGYLQTKLSEKSGVTVLNVIMGFKKIAFSALCKTLTNKHKLRALENLGKHLGIFSKDNKQKVDAFAEIIGLIDGKTKGLPDRSKVPG